MFVHTVCVCVWLKAKDVMAGCDLAIMTGAGEGLVMAALRQTAQTAHTETHTHTHTHTVRHKGERTVKHLNS